MIPARGHDSQNLKHNSGNWDCLAWFHIKFKLLFCFNDCWNKAVCNCCSTILEEEKLQQEERHRMEKRRQVNMSWDSGGSDEAPPKVRFHWWSESLLFNAVELKQTVNCASAAQQTRLPQPSFQRRLLLQPTAQPFPGTDAGSAPPVRCCSVVVTAAVSF